MPCHATAVQPSPAQHNARSLARRPSGWLSVSGLSAGWPVGAGGRAGGLAGCLCFFVAVRLFLGGRACARMARLTAPWGRAWRGEGVWQLSGSAASIVDSVMVFAALARGRAGMAGWRAGWGRGGLAGGGAGGRAGSVAAVAEQRRSSDGHKRTSVHGRCERRPMAPLALAARPSALDPGVNHARPSRPMEQRLNIAQHIITCEPLGRRLCLRFAAGLFLEHEAL